MRALITGITGFVGSHLADYLLENYPLVEVHGIKRWRSPDCNVRHILSKLHLHECDLRDAKSVISVAEEAKPTLVFHLAAESYVPASYVRPVDTIQSNVCGTINLLEAIRSANLNPRIHICSSSEVYGMVKKEDVPITEECPLRPISPYGVSKVGEDLVGYQYFVSYGLSTIRTRAFTHTGPRRGEVFVVSAFAKQISNIEKGIQEPVLRVGNLDSLRTFVDVRDMVRAYWLLLEKCTPGEVYNIGGNRSMKIGQMLDILLSFTEAKIKVRVDPQLLRPTDVTLQIPCVDKFFDKTGWQPEIPFEKTVEDTLEYWRSRV